MNSSWFRIYFSIYSNDGYYQGMHRTKFDTREEAEFLVSEIKNGSVIMFYDDKGKVIVPQNVTFLKLQVIEEIFSRPSYVDA